MGNAGRYEGRHLTTHDRYLFYQAGCDELVLVRRHQAYRFDITIELSVHARHLEFVVEVRDRPQAPNYHGGIVISGEFNQQVIEAFNTNALSEVFSEIGYLLFDVSDSFVDAEQRTFAGIDRDADHQAIEHLGSSVNDISMAVGDGIESSRVDPDQRVCHRSYLPSALRVVDPF